MVAEENLEEYGAGLADGQERWDEEGEEMEDVAPHLPLALIVKERGAPKVPGKPTANCVCKLCFWSH